jgi:prepilin-type N-terminal cleavage/methylation domain-containing protein
MRRRGAFTLIELLAVLFLFAVLAITAGTFMVDALRALNLAERRVQMNRFVPVLHDVWRAALRESDPADWNLVDGGLAADELAILRRDDRLVIRYRSRERVVHLPSILETSIDIERNPGLADCAVLSLRWESRRLTTVTRHHVRLVACGKGRDATP